VNERRRAVRASLKGLILVAVVTAGIYGVFQVVGTRRTNEARVECHSCLHEIYRLGMIHAKGSENGFFPSSSHGGTAALQVLVDENQGLHPELFICLASGMNPAQPSDGGRFQLDDRTCSFETVPWPIPVDSPVKSLLAFDRAPYHSGWRNVVFSDGATEAIEEKRFQQVLALEKQEFSRPVEVPK
jgi:hypothetical protein